jgi:membrane-associated phospholipid phosphatase
MQRPRTAGRLLVAPAARRPAAAMIAACVIITVLLGLLLAGHSGPGRVDAWIDGELGARLGSHPLLADINNLGDPLGVLVICAVAVAACLLARRYRAALLVAIAVAGTGAVTDDILKPLVDRTKDGGLSYPSGHTAAVAAMTVAAVLVLTGPSRPPLPAALRGLLSAALLALIPLVAVSLVIAHYHFFSDTIGGAGAGIAVALGTALGLDAAGARLSARAAPGPAALNPAAPAPAAPDPARAEPAARGGIPAGGRELPPA